MNGLRLSTYQSRSGETTPEASLRPLSNPGNRDREWHSAFVPHHDRRHFLLTANPKRYPYHGNIQSRWISCMAAAASSSRFAYLRCIPGFPERPTPIHKMLTQEDAIPSLALGENNDPGVCMHRSCQSFP